MDIKELRKKKLQELYNEFGGPAGVARMSGTSESYLSQITSSKGSRNLGDKLARKIEKACFKPYGWFDMPNRNESELLKAPSPDQLDSFYQSSKAAQQLVLRIIQLDSTKRITPSLLKAMSEILNAVDGGYRDGAASELSKAFKDN